jgi:ABC-type glutathione transport system ATPase component
MLLLREIVTERRMGLVLISHDLALARAVADEVLTLA